MRYLSSCSYRSPLGLFIPNFLHVTMQSGLYHHPLGVPGARGQIIVGTHCLVSRGSTKPIGPLWLPTGLSPKRVSPFHPVISEGFPLPEAHMNQPIQLTLSSHPD